VLISACVISLATAIARRSPQAQRPKAVDYFLSSARVNSMP
jgi:hypothetical protein